VSNTTKSNHRASGLRATPEAAIGEDGLKLKDLTVPRDPERSVPGVDTPPVS
jgi:hypothetical protein